MLLVLGQGRRVTPDYPRPELPIVSNACPSNNSFGVEGMLVLDMTCWATMPKLSTFHDHMACRSVYTPLSSSEILVFSRLRYPRHPQSVPKLVMGV